MREMPVDHLWRHAPDWAEYIAQTPMGSGIGTSASHTLELMREYIRIRQV